ncbi:MAG: ATP-binding protein [Candidatus Micrarchaeota archaeon]
MGSMSFQAILSSSLARRRFLLRPPEPGWQDLAGQPGSSIYLGRTAMLNVPVFWDSSRLANPHIAIVGMTGSGKSYFIKTFITRASMLWGANALILDWSGEYSPWVEATGGKIIDFRGGNCINALDCRLAQGVAEKGAPTPKSHIERVLSAISVVCSLSNSPAAQMQIKDALKKSYEKFAINADKPIPKNASRLPTLQDAYNILKNASPPANELAILSLEKLCSQNSPFTSARTSINPDELASCGLASINLSSLPSEEHRSLAGLIILQFLKEKMRSSGTQELPRPRLIIVADEAWKIAQDENSDLVQILREARKYSFCLITASQSPSDISKTILSNCATLLAFRLLHHEHRRSLQQSLNLTDGACAQMEQFPVGRALCRLALKNPGAYDGPFIISRIEGEEPKRDFELVVDGMKLSIAKNDFRKKLWRLGLSSSQISQLCAQFEQNDHSLEVHRLSSTLLAFGLSRASVLSFLRDMQVPDSSLPQIFSRLDAERLGVSPSSILNLVVRDE